MASTFHTPGPWDVGRDGEVYSVPAYSSVCMVLASSHGEANACLIAEAPILLALLREVVAYRRGHGAYNFSRLPDADRSLAALEAWERIEQRIDAAITKAEARQTDHRRIAILEQQDHPRAAAHSNSAGHSELEPDGRQGRTSECVDRQGGQGREVGGRAALLASGVQCGQRDVRGKGGTPVNGPARDIGARAALASVDTHPDRGGDPNGAAFMGGAVPSEETADAQTPEVSA